MRRTHARVSRTLVGVALLAGTLALGGVGVGACSGSGDPAGADAGARDVQLQDIAPPPPGAFCALPGSLVWSATGPGIVAGGAPTDPDLTWLTLPAGFCAHYFGTVGDARQLRFAPGGGDLFASPTSITTGGSYNAGQAAIVVLPDDDRDGIADTNTVFLTGLPSVQGLLFANGLLYFQSGPSILSVPYQPGDRQPTGAAQTVATVTAPQDALHWPKVFDVARNGTLYVTNGGSQTDACDSTHATRGAIFSVQPDGSTALVARGFRNPIALRCEKDHDTCLAVELALDYSAGTGGREKLVPVRQGDDWGYPCCATQNTPYAGTVYADTRATPDCSSTVPDTDSFIIGHTPFGIDFETGAWPAPWTGRVFVTLHGAAGSWEGARLVAIGLDPATGLPLPATELPTADNPGALLEFATGWDDGSHQHGRPAAVAFAADGRLFLGDDNRGVILWIAPVGLMRK